MAMDLPLPSEGSPDPGKVMAQVAVAGGVVGSLLPPLVRELSWLRHHPSGVGGWELSWMERCSSCA
jgi:hypothetical protein